MAASNTVTGRKVGGDFNKIFISDLSWNQSHSNIFISDFGSETGESSRRELSAADTKL